MPQSHPFRLGEFELYWLQGGVFEVDGGSMFGVVPRVLWQQKCPVTADGYVQLADAAILVRTPHGDVLIETGLGNKLTEKQKHIFRLRREWDLPAELAALGLDRGDIGHVVLTHCDFDHAGGITMQNESGEVELTFADALHYIQQSEWRDVQNPNRRAASSYWPVNVAGLEESGKLRLVEGGYEVVPGVELFPTGGHTRGHQGVRLTSGGETAIHLGDLLPTPAYSNPLWITAYDNFPLDSIAMKEEIMARGIREGSWFTFYHDLEILACTFDEKGKIAERFP